MLRCTFLFLTIWEKSGTMKVVIHYGNPRRWHKIKQILFYHDAAMSCPLCLDLMYSGNLVGLSLLWKAQEHMYASMRLCIFKRLEKFCPWEVTVGDFPFRWENSSFKGNQSVEEDSIKCRTEVSQRLGTNASKSSLWKCKSNIFLGFTASCHLFHVQRPMAAFITRVRTKCRKSKGEWEIKQNRLWSVIRQRNARKVVNRISTATKNYAQGHTQQCIITKIFPSSGCEYVGDGSKMTMTMPSCSWLRSRNSCKMRQCNFHGALHSPALICARWTLENRSAHTGLS